MAGRSEASPIRNTALACDPYNSALLLEEARLTLAAAMLLVENLPQPVGLVASGDASARESRLQRDASRRVQCRRMAAAMSRWPEPVFQL